MPLAALTGSRLRAARVALGLRQADLAQRADISPSYLNLIEHNRRALTGPVLQRLADALGQPVAAFNDHINAPLLEDLRDAAARSITLPEVDRLQEFVARLPGWAQLTADLHAQKAVLDRSLAALNDRMTQDPHLTASLHEVVSAVSSVRATAAILVETDDLEPEWRARFHANLAQDSDRLAVGAQALVGYLDGFGGTDAPGFASPQEEAEAWFAAAGWHFAPRLPKATPRAGPLSAPAQTVLQVWQDRDARDRALVPEAALTAAMTRHGPDPVVIAADLGGDVLAVFRRIALRPDTATGLVMCDASGTMTFRKPVAGFALPRFGAACPLWPLFAALGRPNVPVETVIETPGPNAQRFVAHAFCTASYPYGYHGAELREAAMLLVPDNGATGRVHPVGATCRTCARAECAARREPSIIRQ